MKRAEQQVASPLPEEAVVEQGATAQGATSPEDDDTKLKNLIADMAQAILDKGILPVEGATGGKEGNAAAGRYAGCYYEKLSIHRQLTSPKCEHFSLKRLAEDLFIHLGGLFKLDLRYLPRTENTINEYVYGKETIRLLSYSSVLYTIAYRDIFHDIFNDGEGGAEAAIKRDLPRLVDYVHLSTSLVSFMTDIPGTPSNVLFNLTLALMVDMALYLATSARIDEDTKKLISKLPEAWVLYFEKHLRATYESRRTLQGHMRRGMEPAYTDAHMRKFIDAHCVVYSGESLMEKFARYCVTEEEEALTLLENFRSAQAQVLEQEEEDDDDDDPAEEELYDRLGFVPHEKLVEQVMKEEKPKKRKPKSKSKARAAEAEEPPQPSKRDLLKQKMRAKMQFLKENRGVKPSSRNQPPRPPTPPQLDADLRYKRCLMELSMELTKFDEDYDEIVHSPPRQGRDAREGKGSPSAKAASPTKKSPRKRK